MDENDNVRVSTVVSENEIRVKTVYSNSDIDIHKVQNEKNYNTIKQLNEAKSAQFEDINELANAIKHVGKIKSLEGKEYVYLRNLSVEGGEGAVVVCMDEMGREVVAKVYMDVDQSNSVSMERRIKIVDFTRTEGAGKFVLPIIDIGLVELKENTKNYFEIQPLCKEGDILSKGKYSYAEIVEIVKELNEGLHYIHVNGFLHMDIKPENIYHYNNHYVFGDFGITRELNQTGNAVTMITHMGKRISGTPGYQATEVLYGESYYNLTPKTDYYALGVTIASMYLGRFVFLTDGKYNSNLFQLSAMNSHIDLENVEDKNTILLQNLIDGLFQFDKNNRFGYDEVKKWLTNPLYKVENSSLKDDSVKWHTPFQGSNKNEYIYNERDLYNWMSSNWEEAKRRLYEGDIERHFQINNEAYIRSRTRKIREEECPNPVLDSDIGLFKLCLEIYQESDTPLIWKGKSWNDLQSLANEILANDSSIFYEDIFKNNLISYWMKIIGLADKNEKIVSEIENIEKNASINSSVACYWFAFLFASDKSLLVDGSVYTNVKELLQYIISSAKKLYQSNVGIKYILDINVSSKMYGFLCSGGKDGTGIAEYIMQYISNMSDKVDEKIHLFFCLLEQIGETFMDKEFIEDVRKAYLKFGPYGDVNYALYIVKNFDYYYSDVKYGENIIESIRVYDEIKIDKVSIMGKKMMDAKKLVDKLLSNMQNNPILAQTGIFQKKDIKCRNLQGYFIYEFLGRNVPLGYKNIIEAE